MEREEIRELALTELLQRSFRLMRENDPQADKAFSERTEITGRMGARDCVCLLRFLGML